jgi:hypothetical protein
MDSELIERSGYAQFLDELKERIRIAQTKAVLSVNRELIALYWDIGKSIVEKQEELGWGKSVVEQLARDLRWEFPDVKGFSPSNIWRMRAFYLAYTEEIGKLAQPVRESSSEELAQPVRDMDSVNLPQVVAEIPWGHNVVLLEKIGSGITRMKEMMVSSGLPEPRYEFTSFFTVIFARRPQVTPQVRTMLAACAEPKSREEIQEILALADRWHLRKAYILPALGAGWLAMTIPDKPRSSKQRYVITEKGKKMMEELGYGF